MVPSQTYHHPNKMTNVIHSLYHHLHWSRKHHTDVLNSLLLTCGYLYCCHTDTERCFNPAQARGFKEYRRINRKRTSNKPISLRRQDFHQQYTIKQTKWTTVEISVLILSCVILGLNPVLPVLLYFLFYFLISRFVTLYGFYQIKYIHTTSRDAQHWWGFEW